MTNTPRPTKNQRREEAREAARIAREKAQQRQKLLKWLVPTIASVAILAIVAGVVWAVIAFQPAPKAQVGPKNMQSDGIVFEASEAGELVPVTTPAIPKGGEPTPTVQRENMLNIVTIVDFTCPACKGFEETYSEPLRDLVAQGIATLEVQPIAILDRAYAGSRYSTRANNVGACVANFAPEHFLPVMDTLFLNQPSEGTTGYTNNELVKLVHGAGLENEQVDTCVLEESFTPWVEAATLRSPATSTPTVIINGTPWDRNAFANFGDFVQSELAKIELPAVEEPAE